MASGGRSGERGGIELIRGGPVARGVQCGCCRFALDEAPRNSYKWTSCKGKS